MRRCTLHARRKLGALLALDGVMLVFVCLPIELFLIVVGVGMTALGFMLLDL